MSWAGKYKSREEQVGTATFAENTGAEAPQEYQMCSISRIHSTSHTVNLATSDGGDICMMQIDMFLPD